MHVGFGVGHVAERELAIAVPSRETARRLNRGG